MRRCYRIFEEVALPTVAFVWPVRIMSSLRMWIVIICNVVGFHHVWSRTCIESDCRITCSSPTNTTSNSPCTGTIDAKYALNLSVVCSGPGACTELMVNCPQSSNHSNCALHCVDGGSCSAVTLDTFTSKTYLHCGNRSNQTTNVSISPPCSNMTITATNFSPMDSAPLPDLKDLDIFNAANGYIDTLYVDRPVFSLQTLGLMTRSRISSISYLTVGPEAILNGSYLNSSSSSRVELDTFGTVQNCTFYLVQENDGDISNISAHSITSKWSHSGVFSNNTVIITGGNMDIMVDGVLHNNTMHHSNGSVSYKIRANGSAPYNLYDATNSKLLYIYSESLLSGWIHAHASCSNLTLHCNNSKDVNRTCRNLTIYAVPPKDEGDIGLEYHNAYDPMGTLDGNATVKRTRLQCTGYGCQSLSIWAKSGMDEVEFVKPSGTCPCSVECLVSCIGDWNLYCSNASDNATNWEWDTHSVFADNECQPGGCCADIVNLTVPAFECEKDMFTNLVCKHDVGLDIALIAAVAGGAVILVFFLFLGVRSVCRTVKQKELRRQYEKRQQQARKEQGSKVMALLPEEKNVDDSSSPPVVVQ